MLTRHRLAWLAALLGLIAIIPVHAPAVSAAATLPAGFSDTLFASGFGGRLTSMTFGPDGRLYVSEKQGSIRIVDDGVLLTDAFLTISVATDSEKGLKSIAFDPNYAGNGFVYLYYTDATTLKNKVSRFTRIAGDPNHLDPTSEEVLVDGIDSGIYHSAGSLHFGPDGKLYISTGDASYAPNAQQLGNLNGKMLRINTDGTSPPDNPFVGQAGKKPQIWAYGLRNPFTFAFNNAGQLYINDVGEATWEEIDLGARGANYGWPTCEGVCATPGMTNPIYAYRHDAGPGKSITGGVFYEASKFPAAYRGDYFFGDYVGNYIKRYDPPTGQVSDFATNAPNPVDLDVGSDGALYYLSVENREVHRIAYGDSSPTPTPSSGTNLVANGDFEAGGAGWLSPWRTVVRSPQTATFTHATSNSYSGGSSFRTDTGTASQDWYAQLLQPGVPLAGGDPYTLTFAAKALAARSLRVAFQKNSGLYPVYSQQTFAVGTDWQTYSLTFTPAADDPQALLAFNFGDSAGRLWIDAVQLTAQPIVGHAPAPSITAPALGTTYRAGQTISFAGSATDQEDGALPAAALTWEIVFHHDTHTHPFIEPFSGVSSGTFTIPDTGESSANTWYRVHLTATDSDGNKTEVTRDIVPLTANVTLATSPSGLGLTVNGIPVTAPSTFKGVVGFKRELGAPATQELGGTTYRFVSWSDGGSATHTIATPGSARTYTAYYEPQSSNLLANGGFDLPAAAWHDPWRTQLRAPAGAAFVRDTGDFDTGPAALRVDLGNSALDWYVQVLQPGVALTSGAQHTLTFAARATSARPIRVAFHQNSGSYAVYFEKTVSIGTNWQTYTVRFTPSTSDPQALFAFNLGSSAGSIWIDDVSLTVGAAAVRR